MQTIIRFWPLCARLCLGAACLALAACAALAGSGAQLLLLGEQHDAPSHPGLHAQAVQELIAQRQLGALVLEMANTHARTDMREPHATEAQVQAALGWNAKAWPWAHYRSAIMAAVRAGVPVVGGNLPQPKLRAAMQAPAYASLFTAQAWQSHLDAVRTGHCNMLPTEQLEPMARAQVARDLEMADTLLSQARPTKAQGKTIVLLAGSGHLDPLLGVPFQLRRLAPDMPVRIRLWPREDTGQDYCAEFKKQMQNMGKPLTSN
jgi:uncharacterized iron-regulated protein